MNGKTKYVIILLVILLITSISSIIYFDRVNTHTNAEYQLTVIRNNQAILQATLDALVENNQRIEGLQKSSLKNHEILITNGLIARDILTKIVKQQDQQIKTITQPKPVDTKVGGK